MAAVLASSRPSLFSQNPSLNKPLRLFSPNPNPNKPHRLSFISRNPLLSPLYIPSASRKDRGKPKPEPIADVSGKKSDPEPEPELPSEPDPPKDEDERGKDSLPSATTVLKELYTASKLPNIAEELGEKSDPEAEAAAEPDPPRDEDERGKDSLPSATTVLKELYTATKLPNIAEELGEKSDPEAEAAAEPDPPRDEDEWVRKSEKAALGYLEANGSTAIEPDSDKLGDLKRCLVDTLYGTEYGLRASAEVRAEISELVSQLEVENPKPAPDEAAEFLDGNWILLYTAFSELLPLVALGATPLLKIKKISQAIDTNSMTIVNATTLSSPFATFSFSATASYEVRSPSRIQVRFKEGAFQPPEISRTINLPENIEIFGQKINLSPVQQSLNPLQEAAANIARSISGLPPLKVPITGDRTASWLLTTYLDKDFRISRGDGGLFVLAKEGSPLLDQLS